MESEQLTVKTVELENRASRGLRVYTPEFLHNGEKLVLEFGGHAQFEKSIIIQEYNHTNSTGHYLKESYDTFKEALEFVKSEYGLNCEFPKLTKDLRSEWTWEQNIAYAEGKNDSFVNKMHENNDIFTTEEEILKYIRDNPFSTRARIAHLFPSNEGWLDRLAHDYGQNTTPFVKMETNCIITTQGLKRLGTDGYIITENGLKFLEDPEMSY